MNRDIPLTEVEIGDFPPEKRMTEDQYNKLVEELKKNAVVIIGVAHLKMENCSLEHSQVMFPIKIEIPSATFGKRLRWLFTGKF